MQKPKFHGTGVALVTPFKSDLSIDYVALERILEHVLKGGVDYLVVLGTTGESATIGKKEKQELVEFVKRNNPGKLPIVLGHGGNDTAKLIEDFKNYDWVGIDGILSVCPYYVKPSQTGLLHHFTALADKSPVPVFLYNIPGRTGVNLNADTTIALSNHPNIVGIKEASADLSQAIDIAKGVNKDFMLIGGDDVLTVPMISVGGVGAISAISNVFPKSTSAMANFALESNFDEANQHLHNFCGMNKLFFEEGNPVGVKAVLSELGLCHSYVRPPLVQASEGLKKKIKEALKTTKAA